MKSFNKTILIFKIVLVINSVFLSTSAMAQEFTLSEIFATPYFSQLNSVGDTRDLVFAVNDQGHRNVYIARYPDYKPENLTRWNEDTGLEITSLSVSRDGQWAVFARGGEHGARE